MAYAIETERVIDAPVAAVWRVLVDFARYPEWNPFILRVDGEVKVGASVPYQFEFPRGLRLWATAHILVMDPQRELRWAAHFLAPSVFNGEHHFSTREVGPKNTAFRHGEAFSGALVPLARPALGYYGPLIYRSLNDALAQRVQALP
jgi:hypothetical protein